MSLNNFSVRVTLAFFVLTGSKTEADGCFGKIALGSPSEAVAMRMRKQPGKGPDSGFIMNPKDFIKIESVRVLGPGEL